MSYMLPIVVRLLRTRLLPAQLLQQQDPDQYLAATTAQMLDCIKAITAELPDDHIHFTVSDEVRKARKKDVYALIERMKYLQRDVTRALNVLYVIMETKYAEEFEALGEDLQRPYFQLRKALATLLAKAKPIYKDYWEKDMAVPHFYRAWLMEIIPARIQRLTNRLMRHDISLHFIVPLTLTPQVAMLTNYSFTWRTVSSLIQYRLQMRPALYGLRIGKPLMSDFFIFPIPTSHLMDTYCNTAEVYLAAFETNSQKRLFLHQQELAIKDALRQYAGWHDEKWETLLAEINDWILTRLQFYKQIAELELSEPAAKTFTGEPGAQKITIHYTIHMMAYIIQFMIDARHITGGTFSDVVRLLAPFIKTDKADLNLASMQTKLKTFDAGVLEKVDDVLMELRNLVMKEKRG